MNLKLETYMNTLTKRYGTCDFFIFKTSYIRNKTNFEKLLKSMDVTNIDDLWFLTYISIGTDSNLYNIDLEDVEFDGVEVDNYGKVQEVEINGQTYTLCLISRVDLLDASKHQDSIYKRRIKR